MTEKRKKKKRKLKKPVKRGCCIIIVVLLLLPALMMYRCHHRNRKSAEEQDIIVCLPPDSVDFAIAERMEKRIRQAVRIDTSLMAVSVYDLERNCDVFHYHNRQLLPPASCTKLPTAIMAMKYMGVSHSYESRILTSGTVCGNSLEGDLVFDMDDDPLIESFDEFLNAVKERGINEIHGDILLRLARKDTLRQHHTAKPWDISYSEVPLLMKGEKHVVRTLARLMSDNGITHGNVRAADCATSGCTSLYSLRHSLKDVITPMLVNSSNVKAECVLHHTLRHISAPSMREVAAYDKTLQDSVYTDFIVSQMGYTDIEGFVVNDGSGLSPDNRLTSDFFVNLMAYAFRNDSIRSMLIDEALATPQHPTRYGSLYGRMRKPEFEGRIFCKTGTLTTIGVSSLTGYALNENGRWFAFSIINGNSPVAESRIFQDEVCADLISSP